MNIVMGFAGTINNIIIIVVVSLFYPIILIPFVPVVIFLGLIVQKFQAIISYAITMDL